MGKNNSNEKLKDQAAKEMLKKNETKSRLQLQRFRAEPPSRSEHPAKFCGYKFFKLSRDLTLAKGGIPLWLVTTLLCLVIIGLVQVET